MQNIEIGASVASVVLLPDQSTMRLLSYFSSRIAGQMDSALELGEEYMPHITIAQFEAEEKALGQIWEDVQKLSGVVSEVQMSGLAFVPDTHGYLWVETSITKSDALQRLQQKVADAVDGHGLKVRSSVSDAYRPHCTVALTDRPNEIPKLALGNPDLLRMRFSVSLALGMNGENFTFIKTCFRE